MICEQELIFISEAVLNITNFQFYLCNFVKKRLQHRSFPKNFENVLINIFLRNTPGWLFWTFLALKEKCRFQSYSFVKVQSNCLHSSKLSSLPQTVLKNSILSSSKRLLHKSTITINMTESFFSLKLLNPDP